jgi:hypothetical protein
MKKKLTIALVLLALLNPAVATAEECEQSHWTVTLEVLEPLSDEERQFVLDLLGIDLTVGMINQAIAEGQVPLSVFGDQ